MPAGEGGMGGDGGGGGVGGVGDGGGAGGGGGVGAGVGATTQLLSLLHFLIQSVLHKAPDPLAG